MCRFMSYYVVNCRNVGPHSESIVTIVGGQQNIHILHGIHTPQAFIFFELEIHFVCDIVTQHISGNGILSKKVENC